MNIQRFKRAVTIVSHKQKHQRKEGTEMKKLIMTTVAASFCLFLIASAAQAQGDIDRAAEGAKLVGASKFMIAQGQTLQAAKNPDRAMLVDRGNLLIKNGYNDIENGEFCYTDDGRSYLQQVGRKALEAGQELLKIGRGQGPLTQKEKDEVAKQAKVLQEFGKLMLANGQTMGG